MQKKALLGDGVLSMDFNGWNMDYMDFDCSLRILLVYFVPNCLLLTKACTKSRS